MAPSDRAPAEVDDSQEQANAGDSSMRAARALWAVTCAGCHGREGRGDGEERPPGAQLPDFTQVAWQQSRTDTQLAQVIRDGKNMMPPFGKRVRPEGIEVLVRYVRTFAAGPTPQPAAAAAAQ